MRECVRMREKEAFTLDLFQSTLNRFKFIFENICARSSHQVYWGWLTDTRPLSSFHWQLEKDRIDGAIAYILLSNCICVL